MFVLKRTLEDLKLEQENAEWWWRQQVAALEKRVRDGEEYRAQLEKKNQFLSDDNMLLYQKLKEAEAALPAAQKRIKELELQTMSLEAHLCARKADGEEDEVE